MILSYILYKIKDFFVRPFALRKIKKWKPVFVEDEPLKEGDPFYDVYSYELELNETGDDVKKVPVAFETKTLSPDHFAKHPFPINK